MNLSSIKKIPGFRRGLGIGKRIAAAVVEECSKRLVVVLVEVVRAYLQIVLRNVRTETHLAPAVGRAAILCGGDWKVGRRTAIVGGVVMEKGETVSSSFELKVCTQDRFARASDS